MITLERKLIDTFRAFMDKCVLPFCRTSDKVLKQWSYFNSILSDEHLQLPKLDSYLMLIAPERANPKSETKNMGPSFAKKEFFEERTANMGSMGSSGNSMNSTGEYKYSKHPNDTSTSSNPSSPYLNTSGAVADTYMSSPTKFIDLNMSKDVINNKDSTSGSINTIRMEDGGRRNLLILLENFQNTLVANQQKLENELKKPPASRNSGNNLIGASDMSGQKRFY